MRAKILPLVLVGSLALGSAAFASVAEVDGTVTKVDPANMTVTLDNGTAYHLADGVKASGLQSGDQVQVTWAAKGDVKYAEAITPLLIRLGM